MERSIKLVVMDLFGLNRPPFCNSWHPSCHLFQIWEWLVTALAFLKFFLAIDSALWRQMEKFHRNPVRLSITTRKLLSRHLAKWHQSHRTTALTDRHLGSSTADHRCHKLTRSSQQRSRRLPQVWPLNYRWSASPLDMPMISHLDERISEFSRIRRNDDAEPTSVLLNSSAKSIWSSW